MRDFFLKHKTEIFIGVITSIIATFLLSLIVPFLQFLTNAGNSFLKTWIDYVFISAARITSYTAAELILAATCAMLISPCLFLIMFCLWKQKRTKEKTNKTSSQIEGTKYNENNIKLKQSQKEIRAVWKMMTVCAVLSVLGLIILASCYLFPVALCDAFEQNAVVIRPYISDQQYYQLYSDWARMKTKENYDDIDAFITKVKLENHLMDE